MQNFLLFVLANNRIKQEGVHASPLRGAFCRHLNFQKNLSDGALFSSMPPRMWCPPWHVMPNGSYEILLLRCPRGRKNYFDRAPTPLRSKNYFDSVPVVRKSYFNCVPPPLSY